MFLYIFIMFWCIHNKSHFIHFMSIWLIRLVLWHNVIFLILISYFTLFLFFLITNWQHTKERKLENARTLMRFLWHVCCLEFFPLRLTLFYRQDNYSLRCCSPFSLPWCTLFSPGSLAPSSWGCCTSSSLRYCTPFSSCCCTSLVSDAILCSYKCYTSLRLSISYGPSFCLPSHRCSLIKSEVFCPHRS